MVFANVPSFRFSFRGNIRRNHPFVNTRKGHWEIKGRFPKGWFWRTYPRSGFRSGGTSAKTTLLETTLLRTPENCLILANRFRVSESEGRECQGPLNGGVSNGGVSRSGLVLPFCPFLSFVELSRFFGDFPNLSGDSPGILPICPFPLSWPINSTSEEQSRKGPRHNLDLSRKKSETPRFGNPPSLASLKNGALDPWSLDLRLGRPRFLPQIAPKPFRIRV